MDADAIRADDKIIREAIELEQKLASNECRQMLN